MISLLPGIDLSAHIGGFAAGVALATLYLKNLDVRSLATGQMLRAVATALAAMSAAAFVLAFLHTPDSNAESRADTTQIAGKLRGLEFSMRELPGFSIFVPAGEVVAHQAGYQTGKLVVRNTDPANAFLISVSWAGGNVSRATLLAAADQLATIPGAQGASTLVQMPGPQGRPIDTLLLKANDTSLRVAHVECGQRYIQLGAMGEPAAEAIYGRMLASIVCTPIPAQEVAATWSVPIVLDLPGWHAVARFPARLALSDGTSTLVLIQVSNKMDDAILMMIVKAMVPDVAPGVREHDRLSFSGTLEGNRIDGWTAQLRCESQAVVLIAFAPDESTATRAAAVLGSARCLRKAEAAQVWPDAPAASVHR